MKIMMVHHFGQVGGGTNSCFDICRMLKEEGHNVTVVIPTPSESVKSIVAQMGVRLVSTPVGVVRLSCHNADSGAIKEIVKYFVSVKNRGYWKTLFQIEQPELVLLNSSVLGPLVEIAHKLGIKTVCFVRETACERRSSIWRYVHKKSLIKADALAFLTNYDIKTWRMPYKGKEIVIPDVVDVKRFDLNTELNDSLASEAKYLLYLGGLSEEKGALDLLRAFRICARENTKLHLIILGDTTGKDFEKLGKIRKFFRRRAIMYYKACKRELASIEQEYGRVLDVGLVSDVSPWYKRADAIIFPVKRVHQARPVFEAGLFHKPVLVPDYEHFEDSVIMGYNGLIYRKNDIEDMAEKILALISDEAGGQRMGNNNYDLYCKNHTYEEAKRRLCKLIDSL